MRSTVSERLEGLPANATVKTARVQFPTSTNTVESEGRQMKLCGHEEKITRSSNLEINKVILCWLLPSYFPSKYNDDLLISAYLEEGVLRLVDEETGGHPPIQTEDRGHTPQPVHTHHLH